MCDILDIWKVISYHVDDKTLAVSKELSEIYDDFWYKNRLQLLFPNDEIEPIHEPINWKGRFNKILSYRNRFNSYISSRLLYKLHCNRNLTNTTQFIDKLGLVKVVSGDNMQLGLKYNGNLYILYKGKYALIDTNVVDMSSNYYIKNTKLYKLNTKDGFENVKHISTDVMQSVDGDFVELSEVDGYVFAAAENRIYVYDGGYKMFKQTSINMIGKFKRFGYSGSSTTVINTNGELFSIYPSCLNIRMNKIYDDVDELYGPLLRTIDSKYMVYRITYSGTKFFKVKKIIESPIMHTFFTEKLRSHIIHYIDEIGNIDRMTFNIINFD